MKKFNIVYCLLLLTINLQAQTPIDNDFNYQGELILNNQLVNGSYDFRITAYDALTDGNNYDLSHNAFDLPVVNGIFQFPLSFIDYTFMGNEIFLEIEIRENGSGQPYELLSPRQKINNVPYAIHAQFVGVDAVTTDDISDGSITTADLADNSINANKISANSVGTSEIINSQVQQRVNGTCSAGNYMRSISQDGNVVCAADNAGNSSVTCADIVDGTITSAHLASNSVGSVEITNGSITSNDIASNSITASMIVANAVGSSEIGAGAVGQSEIDSTEVQQRVNQSCGEYFYLNGINQDGSVSCTRLPFAIENVVSNSDFSGKYNSMAIGSDNLPIISFYNSLSDNLFVLHCGNEICSSGNTIQTLDGVGDVGSYNSLAIGSDGLPIISYHDETNDDLKILHCGNVACDSGNVITSVDTIASVGEYTSITIGSDNLPIVSYFDNSNSDLKVLHCGNVTCSSGNTITTVDNSSDVGRYNSIAIGNDNLAIISYADDSNDNLKILHCGNINCNSGNFQNTVDNSPDVGNYSSLAIGDDNLPIISYYDSSTNDLLVLHCWNTTCSSGNEINRVDSEGIVSFHTNIVIDNNGFPIISYYDVTLDKLKILKCLERDCDAVFNAPEWLISS